MTLDELSLLRGVVVPVAEIEIRSTRSGGPGGQHVNRTASRVTLRFPLGSSPSIPESERARLMERLSSRLTGEGELILHCDEHRERLRNLETGLKRLQEVLRRAMSIPKARRPTRPTRSSVRRRLKAKQQRGQQKRQRRSSPQDDA